MHTSTRLLAALLGSLLVAPLLAAAAAAAAAATRKVDFNNPVRSAQDDEIKQLPGSNSTSLGFKFFAGYLKAFEDGEPAQWLYYWFVESESSPADDPLVLWLGGGPGGSSLVSAVDPNLGPFVFSDFGKIVPAGGQFAWNKMANMLFIEGPVGVGFSYSSQPRNSSDDDSTARANHLALKSFMQKFPHYAQNPLYLTGASYAGVYLSTMGVLVDRDPELNLRGLAVGNGLFDYGLQYSSLILYAHYHGLLESSEWRRISEDCCCGRELLRENCFFDQLDQATTHEVCRKSVFFIGGKLRSIFEKIASDLYLPNNQLNENILRQFQKEQSFYSGDQAWRMYPRNDSLESLDCNPGYESSGFTSMLANQQAFNIPSEFRPNEKILYCRQYPNLQGGVAKQMRSLIESERDLTMLVFNGDADLICDHIGSLWFVESLGRKALSELEHWRLDASAVGLVQQFDGITFATIRAAGHATYQRKPRETLFMLEQFLHSHTSRNVYLPLK